jgi:3alpha(or 20beta)-hydroxysteroid dehydrogenase
MCRLSGKVALVTGGARGIGAATARLMAREGAKVVIADRLETEGWSLAAGIGPAAAYVHLEVTEPEEWRAAVDFAVATFGRLDVLVNNAGIGSLGGADRLSREDWDKVIAVNLTGVFNGIQAAAPAMRKAGGGSIVNLSSVAGLAGYPGMAGYVAAKWGVRGLTKAAALDLAPDKIRVNSVHPGFTRTPMTAAGFQPGFGHVAMHRGGDPDEIARLVTFLASDEASFSTGAEFIADGGEAAGNAAFLAA